MGEFVGFYFRKMALLIFVYGFSCDSFYVLVYIEGLGTNCRSPVFYEKFYIFDTYMNRQISLDQSKYIFRSPSSSIKIRCRYTKINNLEGYQIVDLILWYK